MTFKHFTLATAAACVVAFGNASADNSDKPQKVSAATNTFTALDRNGDHRISRSEAGFDRVLSNTFAEIDTDGDGYVSTVEFAAADKTRNTVSSNLPNQ